MSNNDWERILQGQSEQRWVTIKEAAEMFGGNCDRGRRYRHGMAADLGLGAYALRYSEGTGEKLIELSTHRADSSCRGIGFFHLSQNLRFSDHHGIQACSHPEDVPHGILLAEFVEMGVEFFRLQVEVIMLEAAQVGVTVDRVRNHFHAIAGGDHHSLFDSRIGGQVAAGIGQARLGDRQTLADFERCALVVHANELEFHEAANLWIAEK